ncbi:MAG TPA: NAD(P)H-dependent oxidoreductase subunit E [Bacteroidales bacterium]|nr:NAD(P)H-dependent oxidoreductase subunit E [Bacteroidales bacterium]
MEKPIETILSKYKPARREDLIPILQDIQESVGFLSEDAIITIGKTLRLSTTKIYGLATFYDQFRFIPSGKIHLKICNGTTCFLNGSKSVINKIREELGIEPGQTTRNGNFSYEIVTCMGGCNNGPVILINGEYYTNIREDQVPELIGRLKYLNEIN